MTFEPPVPASALVPTLALLTAHALRCERGGHTVFAGVSLSVHAGEAVWLQGPNGSGKTSLLRLLAGLGQPASGQLQRSTERAYLAHGHALKDAQGAHEALAFLCSLRGLQPSAAQLQQACEQMNLTVRADAPVRRLSQGQRRKLALARLALETAPLWLLDEPYDALDAAGTAALDALLTRHRQAGGAVVLSSHQPVALPGLQVCRLTGRRPGRSGRHTPVAATAATAATEVQA